VAGGDLAVVVEDARIVRAGCRVRPGLRRAEDVRRDEREEPLRAEAMRRGIHQTAVSAMAVIAAPAAPPRRASRRKRYPAYAAANSPAHSADSGCPPRTMAARAPVSNTNVRNDRRAATRSIA